MQIGKNTGDSVGVPSDGCICSGFRRLNVRSSAELEQLVAQAAETITGVAPQQLRDGAALRRQVASELSRVQAALDGLMVDRPRRNLMRSAPEA